MRRVDDRPLLEKIAALKYCIEENAMEDAFNWTLDILDEIHDIEKKKRVKIEQAVAAIPRSS